MIFEEVVVLQIDKERLQNTSGTLDLALLGWAAAIGNEELLKIFLHRKSAQESPRDKDGTIGWYGRAPWVWAAGNGNVKILQILLEDGEADPNEQDADGRTPLSWAAGNGWEDAVRTLLAIPISGTHSGTERSSAPTIS